jgi:hypothetical protein
MITLKYRRLSSVGDALIPSTGSLINRCVSYIHIDSSLSVTRFYNKTQSCLVTTVSKPTHLEDPPRQSILGHSFFLLLSVNTILHPVNNPISVDSSQAKPLFLFVFSCTNALQHVQHTKIHKTTLLYVRYTIKNIVYFLSSTHRYPSLSYLLV